MCHVVVSEGKFEYVDYGSSGIVIYAGHVNSCVLAIAFFNNESTVLAYHWVGFNMSSDNREVNKFLEMCITGHTVSKILVLGNYIYDAKQENERKENMRTIQRVFGGVETHYYTNRDGTENIIIQIYGTGLHQNLDEKMIHVEF